MKSYRKIMATTDFSEGSLPALHEAAGLAELAGADLVLLFVVEDTLPPIILGTSTLDRDEILDAHRKAAEKNLATFAAEHLGERALETAVVVGRPEDKILSYARENGVDLIVMATHGYGLVGQVLFGSTTEKVLHHAPCPVLVVRSR
jgi:universal stress protein A